MSGVPPLIALSAHPRAAPAIRRAKGLGGLGGFSVAALGCLLNGTSIFDTGLRALGGGAVGYLLVWLVATIVWRSVLEAEAKHLLAQVIAEQQAARAKSA